jgi:hypothetical protein
MKFVKVTLHRPLNMPGPNNNAQALTANGLDGQYKGMVKHMVRDDVGYWVFIPGGVNKGWHHIPFASVMYGSGTPPQAVLDLLGVGLDGQPLPNTEKPEPAQEGDGSSRQSRASEDGCPVSAGANPPEQQRTGEPYTVCAECGEGFGHTAICPVAIARATKHATTAEPTAEPTTTPTSGS